MLADCLSSSLPALSDLLMNRKLHDGAQCLDTASIHALHLLKRNGDSNVLPTLRSLLLRIIYRRQKSGHLREYISGLYYSGWVDNDIWDDEVRKVIDAIATRCGLSPQSFYPPTGTMESLGSPSGGLQRVDRLFDNSDATVLDYANKLMWQQKDDGEQRDYLSAAAHYAQLHLGGHSNWRLPTMEELKTIVDIGMPGNAHKLFADAKAERYWTASEFNFVLDGSYLGKSIAYTIDFADGRETTHNKSEPFFVRAVRAMAPEELPQTRVCRLLRQSVEIRPITGYATCMRSLPTADPCKQRNCIYHNSMSMIVYLRKAKVSKDASNEEVWRALGAKDFCRK